MTLVTHRTATGITETIRRTSRLPITTPGAEVHTILKTAEPYGVHQVLLPTSVKALAGILGSRLSSGQVSILSSSRTSLSKNLSYKLGTSTRTARLRSPQLSPLATLTPRTLGAAHAFFLAVSNFYLVGLGENLGADIRV